MTKSQRSDMKSKKMVREQALMKLLDKMKN